MDTRTNWDPYGDQHPQRKSGSHSDGTLRLDGRHRLSCGDAGDECLHDRADDLSEWRLVYELGEGKPRPRNVSALHSDAVQKNESAKTQMSLGVFDEQPSPENCSQLG